MLGLQAVAEYEDARRALASKAAAAAETLKEEMASEDAWWSEYAIRKKAYDERKAAEAEAEAEKERKRWRF